MIILALPDPKIYKPLYKGRIYWVFENNPTKPFEEWTKDIDILLWDRDIQCLIACGTFLKDKSIKGSILWGQGVDFVALDAKHMVQCVKSISKWYC